METKTTSPFYLNKIFGFFGILIPKCISKKIAFFTTLTIFYLLLQNVQLADKIPKKWWMLWKCSLPTNVKQFEWSGWEFPLSQTNVSFHVSKQSNFGALASVAFRALGTMVNSKCNKMVVCKQTKKSQKNQRSWNKTSAFIVSLYHI